MNILYCTDLVRSPFSIHLITENYLEAPESDKQSEKANQRKVWFQKFHFDESK